jgi:hypothetical protein
MQTHTAPAPAPAPPPPPRPSPATRGKAQVLMLVWDDASNNLGLHPGLMATHDNETFQYFKATKVKCVLCPRQGGSKDSLLQVGLRAGRGRGPMSWLV